MSIEDWERAVLKHGVIPAFEARHDDVVQDGNVEEFGRMHHMGSGLQVLAAWVRFARRMIMRDNHGTGARGESRPQQCTEVDVGDTVLSADRDDMRAGDFVDSIDEESDEVLSIG